MKILTTVSCRPRGTRFFLTFSALKASLLVEEWAMLKGIHHFQEHGKVTCA
jgi:hypothetical protein